MPLRHRIIIIPLVIVLALSALASPTLAEGPGFWRGVGGVLCTAGAITIACTPGAATGIGTALVGAEVTLLGAGAGKKNKDAIPDPPPDYVGDPPPDPCDGEDPCDESIALVNGNYPSIALPGISFATDKLVAAVNGVGVNKFLSDIRGSAPDSVIRADLLAMAAQMDSVVYWYNIAEAELDPPLPGGALLITPQMLAAARDSIIASGLPAQEVLILQNAGLTSAEIDSLTAFTIDALGSINLIVQPLTMSHVLQEEADAFRVMGQVSWTSVDEGGSANKRILIEQNTPNPFNPRTTISFSLPAPGSAKLTIFDVRGAHVATLVDADLPEGRQSAEWNGLDERGAAMPSGVYLARLETAAEVQTVKVTLAR